MNLHEFVMQHTERGACKCGHCIDAPPNPQGNQPKGHTVNLTFFQVAIVGKPDVDEFRRLAEPYMPQEETSYITLGADLGEQGFAMQLMALGHLLGIWRVRSPDTEMPFLDDEIKQMMAGRGMVSYSALPLVLP